jgi:hypothetical protein
MTFGELYEKYGDWNKSSEIKLILPNGFYKEGKVGNFYELYKNREVIVFNIE